MLQKDVFEVWAEHWRFAGVMRGCAAILQAILGGQPRDEGRRQPLHMETQQRHGIVQTLRCMGCKVAA